MCCAIDYGTIQVINSITCDFMSDPLFFGILFVKANTRDFRVNEGSRGHH